MEQLAEITIESVAYGGAGVGRREGKTVFVPFSAPGDTVAVRITKVSKRYDEGEIVEILTPSPYRTAPPCPFYGACGGCQIQHLEYEAQLREKRRMVVSAVRKTCGIDPDTADTVPSPERFGYRNRGRLHYRREGLGARLGYFGSRSRELVTVDRCLILDSRLSAMIPGLSRSFPLPDARAEGDVDLFIDPSGSPRYGLPGTAQRMGGFSQVNRSVNRLLQDALVSRVSALGPPGSLDILDLYCGDGNLSLPLAPAARRIEGSDLSGASIDAAVRMAAEAGRRHAEYLREPAHVTAERAAAEGRAVDVLILDPPRSGCVPYLEEFAAVKARTVFYISCVPPILARDLRGFMEHGYGIAEIIPLDMFPQTYHVESLVMLVDQSHHCA